MMKEHVAAYKNSVYYAAGAIPKTQQIVMLYDGVLKFLRQAQEAMTKNDIQERYNTIVKALDVINGLQVCLDHDKGGEIAEILHNYYLLLEIRLHRVQCQNDPTILEGCIRDVTTMRNAWVDIDANYSKEDKAQKNTDAKASDTGSSSSLTRSAMPSAADLAALQSVSFSA